MGKGQEPGETRHPSKCLPLCCHRHYREQSHQSIHISHKNITCVAQQGLSVGLRAPGSHGHSPPAAAAVGAAAQLRHHEFQAIRWLHWCCIVTAIDISSAAALALAADEQQPGGGGGGHAGGCADQAAPVRGGKVGPALPPGLNVLRFEAALM